MGWNVKNKKAANFGGLEVNFINSYFLLSCNPLEYRDKLGNGIENAMYKHNIPKINIGTVLLFAAAFPNKLPAIAPNGAIKNIVLRMIFPIHVFGAYNSSPINVAVGKFQMGRV